MNRNKAKTLADAIRSHLKTIETQWGVRFQIARPTFGAKYFECLLKANEIQADGQAYDEETEDFKNYAPTFGLNPEDLGRVVTLEGKHYKIVGLNMRAKKRPVVVEREGHKYRMSHETAARLIGNKQA